MTEASAARRWLIGSVLILLGLLLLAGVVPLTQTTLGIMLVLVGALLLVP